MALSDKQRQLLTEVAKREGVDPEDLIGAAEGSGAKDPDDEPTPRPGTQQGPKLYMYLLPFLYVREVRQTFLGLSEPFVGDNEVAGDWAAEHGANPDNSDIPPDQRGEQAPEGEA